MFFTVKPFSTKRQAMGARPGVLDLLHFCGYQLPEVRRPRAYGGVYQKRVVVVKSDDQPPKNMVFLLFLIEKIEIGPSKNCRFSLTEPVNMRILPMNGGLKSQMNRSLVRNHMCLVVSNMFETWIHRYAGCEQGGQGSGWFTLCGVPKQVEKCIPDCFNQKVIHIYIYTYIHIYIYTCRWLSMIVSDCQWLSMIVNVFIHTCIHT